jgi:hypothetical protein
MFRIRVFGTSITGLTTIIARNRNNKKDSSLMLFVIYLGHEGVAEYYRDNGVGIVLVRTN